ncbi:hypothetical protein [Halorubrum halodurans]|uniref:IraD/Gp25-like domain-containing protein n=1 Tax=Halorubrum halodurans TaxID=1383851 RepID=A0A256IF33_9EURY|nr:hypothetical protein [Halorubrum halodurans]OYR54916.1 hypothetical protein DJ70_12870 [Halorubrum halodurans]
MDLGLNENFDLSLDDRNDLPLVRGREGFEQRLRLSVTSFFKNVVGDTSRGTARKLIELQAQRIAQQYTEIDRVVQIQTEYDGMRANTINLTIIYDTGDDFTFPISD